MKSRINNYLLSARKLWGKHPFIISSILLILVILLICMVFAFFPGNPFNQSALVKSQLHRMEILMFNTIWGFEINRLGGEKAYEKFKYTFKDESENIRHDSAHLFGKLLYEKYGIAGINYCDDSYSYGCYHILVATALMENGPEAAGYLISECAKLADKFTIESCQHGLGHGILAYYGYNTHTLNQALNLCNKFKDSVDLITCSSGIYMEFNFEDMRGYQWRGRKFDSGKPHYPCNNVDSEFRPGCYFQQSFWWLNALPGNNPQRVKQIEKFCSELTGEENFQCFRGLAIHLGIETGWNSSETSRLCSELETEAHRSICYIQAAKSFVTIPKLNIEAEKICKNNSPDKYAECLQFAGI